MDADLKRCFERDIPYELDALERAYLVIVSEDLAIFRPSQAMANVFVENFWLHARNLTEFFETKRGASTVSPFEFTDDEYVVPPSMAGLRDIINAQITHIQLRRADLDKLVLASRMKGVHGAILKAERHFAERLSEDAAEIGWQRLPMTVERAKSELTAIPMLEVGAITTTATNHLLVMGVNYFPTTGPAKPSGT